jgi:hypothetical protein
MTPPVEIPFPPRHEPHPFSRPEQLFVPVPARWEYREITRDMDALPTESELNALGDEGWELAGVTPAADRVHYYFKRERPI